MAVVMMMLTSTTYGQHLSSARGTAFGAYTAMSTGTSSLDWNPASLVFVRDWELSLSNYVPILTKTSGIVLHSATLTKRFLGDHAVSLRYSPGKALEFVVPTTFQFADSNVVVETTFDQKILYEEPYALGYAYRVSGHFSVGFSGRFMTENVSDTKYFVDTNSVIRSRVVDYAGSSFFVDVGSQWLIHEDWKLGLVVKNLLKISESRLPDEVSRYRLDVPRMFRVGAGYSGFYSMLLGIDVDTDRRFRLGLEWEVMNRSERNSLSKLSFRGGSYFDLRGKTILDAVGFGVGGVFEFMEFDVSYLKFISQTNRKGQANLSAVTGSLPDVEFNQFTSDRISATAQFSLGRTRETTARLEGIKVFQEIYPSASSIYSYNPLAEAYVRNVSDKPVEATVSLFIERLMDVPTEARSVRIEPGERATVPIYAIFNDQIRSVTQSSVREGYVYVTTQRGEEYDDRYQTHLVVHGRNDWNGDVDRLKYFMTPDDAAVLQFTRTVLKQYKERTDSAQLRLRNFFRSRVLFDEFAQRLTYVHDPKKSQDYVQYPSETLSLRGGDCDDMTVCYASLLTSIGLPVAFIDVIPSEKPSDAHIYMMFDTGIEAEYAQLVSDNPKRFVIRKSSRGKETVWIPIETTVIAKGFDEAWSVGAKEYYEVVEIGLGLVKGWVKIVDVGF